MSGSDLKKVKIIRQKFTSFDSATNEIEDQKTDQMNESIIETKDNIIPPWFR